MDNPAICNSGSELRQLARSGAFVNQTAGQAPDYLQGNVVILPKRYAQDFLQYCMNNPKPCPLIGFASAGEPKLTALGKDVDIRSDVPKYRIYEKGKLTGEPHDITGIWSDDFVTFVLGCSFSFEEALIREGYGVRHIDQGCIVPMFKSGIKCIPGGLFNGPVVVTMRPYPQKDIAPIYDLCARYPQAHGTPVYWGDPAGIGIADLQSPDYGDAVEVRDDEVPVFWACGVTPQAAISAAKPDFCITHAPGHMLVTDIPSDSVPEVRTDMTSLVN